MDVICQHPDLGYVIKCDFCMECTKVCNTNALVEWERKPTAKETEA
jgi:formate hydrogenlyase subunit 6/NADH:ubiquinone oxidoreductase subunit I